MRAVVWIVEGTWDGCVDAARSLLPPGAAVALVYVIPEDLPQAMDAAVGGLLGRWRPRRGAAERLGPLSETAGRALLEAAAQRLGRTDAEEILVRGRAEQMVVRAADGADLLVVSRDGDQSRLGPHSLGHATRFVVDHAPCQVLLVWPDSPPAVDTIPSPHHPPA